MKDKRLMFVALIMLLILASQQARCQKIISTTAEVSVCNYTDTTIKIDFPELHDVVLTVGPHQENGMITRTFPYPVSWRLRVGMRYFSYHKETRSFNTLYNNKLYIYVTRSSKKNVYYVEQYSGQRGPLCKPLYGPDAMEKYGGKQPPIMVYRDSGDLKN